MSESPLARLALSQPLTEAALGAKATALGRLVDSGDRSELDDEQLRAALLSVASTDATSARGVAAVLAAISALERLDGVGELVWPSETPGARVTEEYWHPFPAHRVVDALDTQGKRDLWRTALEGPPPWLRHPPPAEPEPPPVVDELASRRRPRSAA